MSGSRSGAIVIEPVTERVRGLAGATVLVDTRNAVLLHEGSRVPVYYFPLKDVVDGVLVPTGHSSHCPLKGEASYYSVRLPDGRIAQNGVWRYPHPVAGVEAIADSVAFYPHVLDRIVRGDDLAA
ncbi:MAG: DUF427 domain-containing protein [Bauldia sp.]|nr:DUF427 domain-containing protein [Bauldia sp.]